MELFKYNPTPYVNTQVDLPLDFLQGQLETKQKEFDSQSAAVDKAAENFMKINPGMLTKDAYDRVKKQYLPEIEKIRDTLHQTGNVSMAAPALSRFTMNLAADPQVKNIMEDYKLTESYNKNLQEGKYTDKVFAGMFDAKGKQRAQLGENEMTSASYYNPMQYTDPVASLLEEAKVFKANTIEDINSNPNKYGLIQTDSVTVENLANERVRQWANDRYATWKQHPENQAYFWNATGFKPETYTPEMWDQGVAKNIADLVSYKKVTKDRNFTNIPTEQPIQANPNKKKATAGEEANKKTGAPVSRFMITGNEGGLASYQQGKYQDNVVRNLDEFNIDLDFTKSAMQKGYTALAALSNGAIPAGLDVASGKGGSRTVVRDWVNNNYTKNDYGEWVAKPKIDENGNTVFTAPPVTPEIAASLNEFTEANYAHNAKETLFNSLKKQAGFDPNQKIDTKKYNVYIDDILEHGALSNEWAMAQEATPESPEFTMDAYTTEGKKKYDAAMEVWKKQIKDYNDNLRQGFVSIFQKKIFEEIAKKGVSVPELKIYKAFENFKNKMSEYQLSSLPGDGKFPEYERQLINMALAGQLSGLTNVLDGVDAAEGTGLEAFKAAVPYNKDKGGVDTDNISLSMGYSPKKGVVGVIAMNGTYHEFDLDKANLDQQFTHEYPELTQELRIYRDISKSIKRSSNTEGNFNVGSIPFVFDVKTKNIGTDKPEFYYEFSADGVNKQRYSNVGEIIAIASDVASTKLNDQEKIVQIIQDGIADKATAAIARAKTFDEVNQIKQQAAEDMVNAPAMVAETYNKNNKPIGGVGKQGQFRQTPKTPLQ